MQQHLDALTPKLDEALASFASDDREASTCFLLFEYNSPQFDSDFPIYVMEADARGELNEPAHLVADGTVVGPSEIYNADRFEGLETWDEASVLVEAWLINRWGATERPAIPAFLGHHDSYFWRDMADASTTNWDEILRRFRS